MVALGNLSSTSVHATRTSRKQASGRKHLGAQHGVIVAAIMVGLGLGLATETPTPAMAHGDDAWHGTGRRLSPVRGAGQGRPSPVHPSPQPPPTLTCCSLLTPPPRPFPCIPSEACRGQPRSAIPPRRRANPTAAAQPAAHQQLAPLHSHARRGGISCSLPPPTPGPGRNRKRLHNRCTVSFATNTAARDEHHQRIYHIQISELGEA